MGDKKLFDTGEPKLTIEEEFDPPAKPVDIGKLSPPLPFPSLAGAEFSECRTFRYLLWRRLLEKGPTILFIGANPSVADEDKDDPTMRREINFSKAWGYALLLKCNVCSYVSTDPKGLRKAVDPVGPLTDEYILKHARMADLIVFACGNAGAFKNRFKVVNELLMSHDNIRPKLHALGWTKLKFPRHTLYLSSKLKPVCYGIEKEIEL